MMNRGACVVLAGAVLALPPSICAQDAAAAAGPEITPYVSLGSNASYGVGGAIRWPLPGAFSLELDTSYRRSAVSPLSANLSLLFDFPPVARVTPYVAGGIGLDQYAAADTSASGHIVTQAGTAIAVNAGGGIRVRSTERWGIRTDARWSNGLGDRAPERWRVYNGVTVGRQGR
jgi:hypothetical protein